ncbi:MAG: hypothetical protein Ct9H300mP16_13490 [Pseudomonadota bacterium]|nr:MAG: hypothetical protein Ct9H300mP16_13490 [Pseudomonadota bacterium]
MSGSDVLKMIQESNVKFVDFRFTDTRGRNSMCLYRPAFGKDDTFEEGKMFDGSSIAGWKGINESDMILMPDPDTAVVDPFMQDTTLLFAVMSSNRPPCRATNAIRGRSPSGVRPI